MSKSIMSMADEILGGALTQPSKASTHNFAEEKELPEVPDNIREGMIMDSLDEKLGPELSKYKVTTKQRVSGGPAAKRTTVDVSDNPTFLSPKAQAKFKAHRQRAQSRREKDIKADPESQRKERERQRAMRRSQGIQRRPGMENSNLQILLRARDILREMTACGSIGTAQMEKPKKVSVTPVDKALRKTDKKSSKKMKKESFESFLDRIISEHQR